MIVTLDVFEKCFLRLLYNYYYICTTIKFSSNKDFFPDEFSLAFVEPW